MSDTKDESFDEWITRMQKELAALDVPIDLKPTAQRSSVEEVAELFGVPKEKLTAESPIEFLTRQVAELIRRVEDLEANDLE